MALPPLKTNFKTDVDVSHTWIPRDEVYTELLTYPGEKYSAVK